MTHQGTPPNPDEAPPPVDLAATAEEAADTLFGALSDAPDVASIQAPPNLDEATAVVLAAIKRFDEDMKTAAIFAAVSRGKYDKAATAVRTLSGEGLARIRDASEQMMRLVDDEREARAEWGKRNVEQ